MYKGAFLKQSRGRFLFSPPLPLPIFFFSPQLSRDNSIGNACYARAVSILCLNRNGYLSATQSKVTPK